MKKCSLDLIFFKIRLLVGGGAVVFNSLKLDVFLGKVNTFIFETIKVFSQLLFDPIRTFNFSYIK